MPRWRGGEPWPRPFARQLPRHILGLIQDLLMGLMGLMGLRSLSLLDAQGPP